MIGREVVLDVGLPATANHLVFKLLEGLESAEPWTSRIKALEELEKYSTAYRYPSAGGRSAASPPVDDVRAYIEKLRALIDLARSELLK
ncbi:MAG: hypothetical protein H6718_29800 [Polyangiaceae bacterium]|nr:hypothetical protein [Polyangiaceae bacterium]